ncbi:TerD family protein [Actinomadura sp. NEAU-AAG7]|uniref:TerD family protein n=1 Tax=Actinomadura sp. NEAU-AAG7 TaxID=2839640 RepID=UPI001BE4DE8B|nr:TerD family protein [Actinomadura sp. NEAU-AAG7]MBT2213848.1 TerD family protein [Actinomadura sp. NEAU-AAG7]
MQHTLGKGGNAPLDGRSAAVTITAAVPVDVSALLLTGERKVRGDHDLVFFNHPEQDGVSVENATVTADLGRVPPEVHTVAIVASVDADRPGARFDASTTPRAAVVCGQGTVAFEPPPLVDGETVAVLLELYRRGDGWKVRAVGQGWASGLAGLAADYGVTVDDPGPAAPAPVAPPVAAPAAAPLGKITLKKAGKASISLDKRDTTATVTASLEWDGGKRKSEGADLDLYALFVPAHQVSPFSKLKKGRKESDGVVYYRDLGALTAPPFIQLDGDATVPGRETVRITRPDQQGYVLICAYSAVENGTGSFKSYGARAVVTDGRGSTVTVPLFHSDDYSYWVAIALVDFTVPDGFEIRHVERYSDGGEARPMLYTDGTFEMDEGPMEFKGEDF